MRCVMGPAQWSELLDAYERGATAADLARQWGVSISAIYRHARLAGREKSVRPRPVVETFVPEPAEGGVQLDALAAEEGGSDLIADVYAGELHEPGFLARMAVSASGQALRAYAYDEARTLARLAEQYTRLSDRGKQHTNLHTVLRAMFNKSFADELFKREEGERNLVKDLYWEMIQDVEERVARKAKAEADRLAAATVNATSGQPTPADAS